jgi:hypothetical protein
MSPGLHWENDYRKDSRTQDVFRKRKVMVLDKDMDKKRRDNIILWNTFFRRNPHRFIETV